MAGSIYNRMSLEEIGSISSLEGPGGKTQRAEDQLRSLEACFDLTRARGTVFTVVLQLE